MRYLNDILAKIILVRDSLREKGQQKHAADLDAHAGALYFLGAGDSSEITSHAPDTSDSERVARLSGQEKARLRRLKKRRANKRPARKRYVCCTPLEKRRTRRGTAWASVCHYVVTSGKRRGQMAASSIMVSYGNQKPKAIIVKESGRDRRMSFCRSGQLERAKAKFAKKA